jgi:hypothetical protein
MVMFTLLLISFNLGDVGYYTRELLYPLQALLLGIKREKWRIVLERNNT